MFGCLAMLKSIADEFNYASIDRFRKVKVFFLNAASKQQTRNKEKGANSLPFKI